MLRRIGLPFLVISLLCMTAPISAKAETPTLLGQYGGWKAYTHKEDSGLLCFMSATPTKSEGKYSKRGNVYAMISHRPSENSKGVFSYITGYTYRNGEGVTVTIDGQKFLLVGQGENAWTPNDEQDRQLAEAIQKGSKMTVEGISSRGTRTKDTFSLKGSGDAYTAISKACGM